MTTTLENVGTAAGLLAMSIGIINEVIASKMNPKSRKAAALYSIGTVLYRAGTALSRWGTTSGAASYSAQKTVLAKKQAKEAKKS